jgi:hypothetical protein
MQGIKGFSNEVCSCVQNKKLWQMSKDYIRGIIRGGLGNQLLQLAALKTISKIANRRLLLDISSYESENQKALGRKFEVAGFFPGEWELLSDANWRPIRPFAGVLRQLGDLYPSILGSFGILAGEVSDFSALDSRFLKRARYVDNYFSGIGGNPTFGHAIKEVIDQLGKLTNETTSESNHAIHLRLGDYLSIDQTLVPDVSRLRNVLRRLISSGMDVLTIYSDEPPRALELIEGLELNVRTELARVTTSPLLSLSGLASHKVLICSSSTFSWWAGTAIASKGGRVFFPDPEINGIPNLFISKSWELY